MAHLNYDSAQYNPSAPLEAIPPGEYVLIAKSSEIKPTKSGSGHLAQFEFEVNEGEYKGRKMFIRMNVQNSNQTTEEIGRRELAALAMATLGTNVIKDTDQVHYKPFLATVDVEKSEGYAAKNVVRAYKVLNGAAGQPAAGGQSRAATAGGAPQPAWNRPGGAAA